MESQKEMRTRAQNLRKSMTKEEQKLWYQFLRKYPLQFKRQYQIGVYYADFYCYRAKLIVELDGSQHCEPEALEHDRRRTRFLESQGFCVIRISNLDVLRNFPSVCEYIDRIVKERIHGMGAPWLLPGEAVTSAHTGD